MLRKMNSVLAILAMLTLANSSLASSYNTVDVSTGVNVGVVGNPLYPTTTGTRDDYWMVRSTPQGAQPPNTKAWIIFLGAWNAIPGTRPIYGNNNNVGTSEYERCFCLQSTEKAILNLTMRADNKANLFINSYFNPAMQAVVNNTFNTNSVPAVQFTYTAQNGLKVGRNCIRARINNEGGPTGFALKATLQGYGALDTADQPCCRQGAPVFTEPMRARPVELDPTPSREGADPRPDGVRPPIRDIPGGRSRR
ncbi:MAG TPA: hypothetical protein VEY11_16835 [Pyrinomonadaceae bacterium]|nr:hypothetical protein [Pyrinomonadaceae bacterium]